ncbi:MAG: hypothetical protein DMF19_11950 [Verrucomicrobia bacterium]|nr:MAG: hypothetical protein DMF19_11950 [Verrucomicrobiota bacterium]
MKSNKRQRHDGANDTTARKKERSGTQDFSVEKYGEETSEKQECEEALLAEYAAMLTLYTAGFAALISLVYSHKRLPNGVPPLELLVLAIATHKLSRIVAKDRITGALRAPFVHYKRSVGEGEVEEEPRGRGLQRAVGELISCPYCMGPWCAAALGFGMAFVPRITRFFASTLAAVAMSDFLHRAYAATKQNGT